MTSGGEDPLRIAIEAALAEARSAGRHAGAELLVEMAGMRWRIAALVGRGEAARAAALLETLLGGAEMASAEDSDRLVDDLLVDWIGARGAAGEDPAETAVQIVAWIQDRRLVGPIERRAVEALDEDGREALGLALEAWSGSLVPGSSLRRRVTEIRKAILARRGDAAAYVALSEEEGLLGARDCEALARMCEARRPREALAWMERGLALDRERGALPEMAAVRRRRDLLMRLGRRDEAVALAWEEHRARHSRFTLEELMRCAPDGERDAWRARALTEIASVPLPARIEVLSAAGEAEGLAGVVAGAPDEELRGLSHFVTEPAAECLRATHPLLAARIRAALAMRLLATRKSKRYALALEHLRMARDLFLDHGGEAAWKALVEEVRRDAERKTVFFPAFERLVGGGGAGKGAPSRPPQGVRASPSARRRP